MCYFPQGDNESWADQESGSRSVCNILSRTWIKNPHSGFTFMLQNSLCVYTDLNGGGGEGFMFQGFALVLPTLTLYVQLRMNDDCVFMKCCLGSYSSFILHMERKYSHIHTKSFHIIYTYTFIFQEKKRAKLAYITIYLC